ncbi:MAG: ABC transporter substrate-binding protein, partial [Desulfurococcales archaeon]
MNIKYYTYILALSLALFVLAFALITAASQHSVGGTLTVALVSEPSQIVLSNAWNAAFVESQIFDTLLRFDSNLNLVPGLAESYYVNSTCGCYVFNLRTNATWHDGKPVTADDVKFTFENIVPQYTNYGSLYFGNTTVTILNSTAIMIKPSKFLPGVQLQLFAAKDTTAILPKHILEGQDFLKSSFLTNP